LTCETEFYKAADTVGADKTAQILGEAEFDAAMLVDAGIGVAKISKAGVGWAKNAVRSERAFAEVAAESSLASRSNFGTLPKTGVSKFDELVVGTQKYEKWVSNLEKRGYNVELAELGSETAANILGKNISINPETFSYIDLLHESRHIRQVEKATEMGVSTFGNVKNAKYVRKWFEKGAYEYEQRLGKQFGFSDEYMNFVGRQIDNYWSKSVQQKAKFSESVRKVEELWR
jgi:hypothetical protein